MYPKQEIELTSSVAKRYSSIMLGNEKFGSKIDCRNLPSARVMASWTTDDCCIDICAPSRPGIVNYYILHSAKINGEFFQHVFAIVWWYKAVCDEEYFGKPAQAWKLYDYEPCGPALFMPVGFFIRCDQYDCTEYLSEVFCFRAVFKSVQCNEISV